jgi:uncharacterized cupin superfamily protein
MVLQGTPHVVSDDGTKMIKTAGDAYSIAPGLDAWVVGDKEYIAQFQLASATGWLRPRNN